MKKFIKQHFTIVIAFSLPILLLATVGINAFIASKNVKTIYNFIYIACDARYTYSNNCTETYRYGVIDNQLIITSLNKPSNRSATPGQIFLYNTNTDTATEISITEAQNLKIFDGATSPDGVTF